MKSLRNLLQIFVAKIVLVVFVIVCFLTWLILYVFRQRSPELLEINFIFAGCFMLIGTICYFVIRHKVNRMIIVPIESFCRHMQQIEDNELSGFIPNEDENFEEIESLYKSLSYMIKKDERKKVFIKEHLHFTEMILDNIPSPIFYKDNQGIYRGCNIAFEKYIGKAKNQIINKTVYDLAPKELAEKYFQKDAELFKQAGLQVYESQVKYADGTLHDVIFKKATYTDRSNNVAGLIGIILDISERKKVEDSLRLYNEQFLHVLDNMHIAVVCIDIKNYIIIYANRYAFKLYGESIIGKKCWNTFYDKQQANPCQKCVSNCLENQKESSIPEELFHPIQGLWLLHQSQTIKWSDGRSVSLKMMYDITAMKTSEQELIASKQTAEYANKLKTEFLVKISHEIISPLNDIYEDLALIKKTKVDGFQQKYFDNITLNIKMLLRVMNNILDLSKIESGLLKLEKVTFSFEKTLKEIFDPFSKKASEKNIGFFYSVHSNVPSYLQGDPLRLKQVLEKLVENAFEFTQKGSVLVDINFDHEDKDYVVIHFLIKDTGAGIPKGKIPTLFESFSQTYTLNKAAKYVEADKSVETDKSFNRKFSLGLAIAKRLVEKMGGRIGVESEVGFGSLFWFTSKFNKPNEYDIKKYSSEQDSSQERSDFDKKASDIINDPSIFNYDYALNYVENDKNLLKSLVSQFMIDTPSGIDKIKSDIENKNMQSCTINAHSIKNNAAMLGASRLSKVAYEMEIASNESKPDEVLAILKKVQEEYEQLKDIFLELFYY